ncbi:hypothetical protein HYPGJ_20310 [Hyphomicrobium sp. GJ21]|nr:hypothetical protein HYPGJ_20310 [Hyphomicrobium sp. GJ21]
MAWFGWKSIKEAEIYTRAADQKKLANSVAPLIGGGQYVNGDCPTLAMGQSRRDLSYCSELGLAPRRRRGISC